MMEKQIPEMIVFPNGKGVDRSSITPGTKAVLFQNNYMITQSCIPSSVKLIAFTDRYIFGIMGVASKGVTAYVCKGSMTAIHATQNQIMHKVYKPRQSETPEELLKRLYAKETNQDAVPKAPAPALLTPSNLMPDSRYHPISLLTNARLELLLVKSMRTHADKIATALVTQIEQDTTDGILHLTKPYHLASFTSSTTADKMKATLSELLPVDQLVITYLNCSYSIDMVVCM